MPGTITVLGPQRPHPNLPDALEAVRGEGRLVLLSAGWRWDEGETGAYRRALHEDVLHVPLYHWFQQLRESDPALNAAYTARQDELLAAKRHYQVRLRHAIGALQELRPSAGSPGADEAIVAALEHVRALDAAWLTQSAEIHANHPLVATPEAHDGVAHQHAKIASVFGEARAVMVAGGHVGVLRQRLHAFGVGDLLRRFLGDGGSVYAWSAGAMALSERIVLFYDDPPEGPSHPELFDTGLGLLPGVLWLPHARRRLRLDVPERVGLLASRFGPAPCVGLEQGAWLRYAEGTYTVVSGGENVLHLQPDGAVVPWQPAGGAA